MKQLVKSLDRSGWHHGLVEPQEVLLEEANVFGRNGWDEGEVQDVGVRVGVVQRVDKGGFVVSHEPPERCGRFVEAPNGALALAVFQERPEAARVELVNKRQEQVDGELETRRELSEEVGHAIDEEQEDRRALVRRAVLAMATALIEFVPKVHPLFLT